MRADGSASRSGFARVCSRVALVAGIALALGATAQPAVLFCAPQGASIGMIDLTYLSELHAKGFEVDYTDHLADITWERIRRYNVLVVYGLPKANHLFDHSSPG